MSNGTKCERLYYLIQRYKFESNSQLVGKVGLIVLVLYYLIQRYKFESNSQPCYFDIWQWTVVLSDTKIQIWKQFTTRWACCAYQRSCIIWYKDTNLKAIHNLLSVEHLSSQLYYLIQRYKFESNSQRPGWPPSRWTRCIIWYKDTNLKAIHNTTQQIVNCCTVVLSDTKIQIWKQFTTSSIWLRPRGWLYYLIQRYKFESNSQHLSYESDCLTCCIIWYKDTNLKAIHNASGMTTELYTVVLSDTKIQIWKQFTTSKKFALRRNLLYYLIQRYKFESNSQPFFNLSTTSTCCIIWYKDTNLKAIHNACLQASRRERVVLSDTKIQIWKQFTTRVS